MKQTEQQIINWIREDEWMMEVLRAVRILNLPDWWICAGFIRSKIWDTIHQFSHRTPLTDIDVIYYDSLKISEEQEKLLEKRLKQINPNLPWSVKNQARMHVINNFPMYTSSMDGMAHFPKDHHSTRCNTETRWQYSASRSVWDRRCSFPCGKTNAIFSEGRKKQTGLRGKSETKKLAVCLD